MIKSWTHFHGAPGVSGEKVRRRCDDLSDKQADEEAALVLQVWSPGQQQHLATL